MYLLCKKFLPFCTVSPIHATIHAYTIAYLVQKTYIISSGEAYIHINIHTFINASMHFLCTIACIHPHFRVKLHSLCIHHCILCNHNRSIPMVEGTFSNSCSLIFTPRYIYIILKRQRYNIYIYIYNNKYIIYVFVILILKIMFRGERVGKRSCSTRNCYTLYKFI